MRLSKITTRTGDNGSTGLADGTRPGNDHARITALPHLNRLSDLCSVASSIKRRKRYGKGVVNYVHPRKGARSTVR